MQERAERIVRRYGDALLAAAIVAIALAQIVGLDEPPWTRIGLAASVLVLGVAAAHRVRFPLLLVSLLVASLVVGALFPKPTADVEAMGFFFFLAIYTAAAHTGGRRAVVAGILTAVLAVAVAVTDPEELNLAGAVFFGFISGGPWLAGRVVRRRRLSEARLEAEKASAEAAIAEERSRIARELHDVVAHAISVMVLQARAGRKVFSTKPEESLRSFDTIERTGSLALDEMRRLLGMLRAPDDELALAPQPSLTHIDVLVDQVRAAGLPVDVEVEGEPVVLPPGVDLSAYRIVQEALTNALKHAGPASARVRIRYEPDELSLEISDDGHGDGDGGGSGHGLAGMKERVSVFGGELEAGARVEGGYALRARLPIASARS